jgi:flavorubredoxin
MHTRTDEIADGIFRISTLLADIAPGGFAFNQFLVRAEAPLLFHTGPRLLFPQVSAAVSRLVPIRDLRYLSFGHVEGDECGAMNLFLAAAADLEVVHTPLGCELTVADLADRPPRALAEQEWLDLGGRRVRLIPTPHVPHNWEACVMFEQVTGTLFCGDLLGHAGDGPAIGADFDIVAAAFATDDMFGATAVNARSAPTVRALAELAPRRLAVMHGTSWDGDCAAVLSALADGFDSRLQGAVRAGVPA